MALPVGQIPPASLVLAALAAVTTHVPQLLTVELRRKAPRPIALFAIGVYLLLCIVLAGLGYVLGA
jgi:hypothetical protein